MIIHRRIPARDLKPGLATIVVAMPRRTIRSRALMVQVHAHGVVQVAFASGDVLSLSTRAMFGRIKHPRLPRPPRAPRRAS